MSRFLALLVFYSGLFSFFYLTVTGEGGDSSEIEALTAFKLSLHDPLGSLEGWSPSTPSAPCDWYGIVCFQNHVYELNLSKIQLGGSISSQISNLSQLRKLSLHSNNLNGSIPTSISLCSFLCFVYLQNNSLSGRIPPDIFNLASLQDLNLAHNLLAETIPSTLTPSLRYLDLSTNFLTGELPSNFPIDSQLQYINLSYNNFSGEIPGTLGLLRELKNLALDSNQLSGTIPSTLADCLSLVHLSADDNGLQGVLPMSVGYLPELEVVSFSRNRLSGEIPSSYFCSSSGNSSGLKVVRMALNEFTGITEPQESTEGRCIGALEVLDLHGNRIEGSRFISLLTRFTTLRVLDLSSNLLVGDLPFEVANLSKLVDLNVSNNSLTGQILPGLLKCVSLQALNLEGNRFTGEVPQSLGELKNVLLLSLGKNQFSGPIPSSIGRLTKLQFLGLGNNKFDGIIPEKILNLGNLSTLDLSYNQFQGDIPWGIGNLTGLASLNMSGCGFSGMVPKSIGKLFKLSSLDLSKQNLSGELPVELFGLPRLALVALQENNLSGDVLERFSNLVGLRSLNLSFNRFTGEIPKTFGFLQSLESLSLSGNLISNGIPSEIGNCSDLLVLQLRSNNFAGTIPREISSLANLQELDLGENKLSGDIPEELCKCTDLISLRLDSNHLSGHIPESLGKMRNLVNLNLSYNSLVGSIPSNLSYITSLVNLDLSHNLLEGEIPKLLGLKFNESSTFSMNSKLCGQPLSRECPKDSARRRNKLILLICVAVGGTLMILLCCCGYAYSLMRWRTKLRGGNGEKKWSSPASSGTHSGRESSDNAVPKLVMFNNKVTYQETLEATKQFDEDNVLSRGKYGLLFKASYQDGLVFAVRKLPNTSVVDGNFRKQAEALGKVKHRNLTVLRGYYHGPPDVRLLVYDYMPNGNLATLLQEASNHDWHVLNWPMRHLIALGIARGLSFLHSISIVHGDVKPQNVLFDADFEAHLSEFGLDKLGIAPPPEAPSSSTTIGSLGYVVPEAAVSEQPTREGDVYCFGIVLLEILTGKRAIMFTDDEDIVKWVKKQLQSGQVSELLEPGLLGLDPQLPEWEEFLLGLKVGLLCTARDPLDRPSMADVVFMLEGCRVGPDVPSSGEPTSMPSPV